MSLGTKDIKNSGIDTQIILVQRKFFSWKLAIHVFVSILKIQVDNRKKKKEISYQFTLYKVR
jgi:hypothetical protein